MSPVPGFEAAADAFQRQLQDAGVRCLRADTLIAETHR
jgi:hypothetical protein